MLTCWWWFTQYYLFVRTLACTSINSEFKTEHICLQLFLHPADVSFSHALSFSFDVMLNVAELAQPCLYYFKSQAVFWVLAKSWPWSAAECSTDWKRWKLWNNIAELKKRGCSRWKQVSFWWSNFLHEKWKFTQQKTPHTPLSLHGAIWNLMLKKKTMKS